jgi:glucokinase
VWRTLESLIARVLAAAPTDVEPSAVGVCCVGPIDVRAGAVSPLPVGVWSSFPIRDRLEQLTGRPVSLGTAAAAIAEVERWLGDAVDLDDFVTVLCDSVVESACVLNGQRLCGQHGNAGSLAHVTVDPGGLPCFCGADGCLTPYVSADMIEAEINRPLARARPAIVERAGIMLGRAMASMAATLDVTTFMISGRVIDTFAEPMLRVVQRELSLRSKLSNLEQLRVIEPSGYAGSLVGAAALARRDSQDDGFGASGGS